MVLWYICQLCQKHYITAHFNYVWYGSLQYIRIWMEALQNQLILLNKDGQISNRFTQKNGPSLILIILIDVFQY